MAWVQFYLRRPQLPVELARQFDDCVDAFGLIGQLLDTIMPGNKPAPPEKKKQESGYHRYDFGGAANDWMTQ